MVTLYTFSGAWGLLSLSPFCAKVEAYLRLAEVPHRIRSADPRRAPRGKAPYIEHEGTFVPDSGLILDYLKERFGDPLDGPLDAQEHAVGHLVRRTCEESLYWIQVYSRWSEDEGFGHVRAELARLIPPMLLPIAAPLARRKALKQLKFQGTALRTREEVYAHGVADLTALCNLLGEQDFLFGDAPSTYDVTLYAFLANSLRNPTVDPLRAYVERQPTLVGFVDRIESRWDAPAGPG